MTSSRLLRLLAETFAKKTVLSVPVVKNQASQAFVCFLFLSFGTEQSARNTGVSIIGGHGPARRCVGTTLNGQISLNETASFEIVLTFHKWQAGLLRVMRVCAIVARQVRSRDVVAQMSSKSRRYARE